MSASSTTCPQDYLEEQVENAKILLTMSRTNAALSKISIAIGFLASYLQSIARWIVLTTISESAVGSLRIRGVNGKEDVIGIVKSQEPSANITVHNEFFWLRVLLFGDIGFSQSYMLGEISCTELTRTLEFFIHNSSQMNPTTTSGIAAGLRRLFQRIAGSLNSISTAKLNANAHYSLSNDMFEAFLSPDMTYSAPLWLPTSDPRSREDTLEEAQIRKLQYAISATHIKSTDHVLEIGTGWGSFAILASQKTGCRVTTVTPSEAQKKLAEQRIADAGLVDRITVLLADYRELSAEKPFDKIVSIEMIEHVGPSFLATYFDCMNRYLKRDGGIAYFQCITIPEARYEDYAKGEDFIKKYIFPGGHLPTVSGLVASIVKGSKSRLVVEETKAFGGHYSKALRCWRENFLTNFNEKIVAALQTRYPAMTKNEMAVLKRKWEYYFCYCEAGFKTKWLGDVGITVAREGCVEMLEEMP